jgi:cytochrome d ubiquinol oxidase subunit I
MDEVLLSRMQFAFTAGYHFIFVPITIGVGLIMAILVTKAYKSGQPEDDAIARMWVKIYTATFAIGVATGITMEFSFGTNWANYSRFVGDIFGAPLAAEALFSFFLESIFLGIVIFGRKKVRPVLYCVSAWLTFAGSALSALWIIIANSWMQTPAGATLSEDGTEAVITNFFEAAFNPSTLVRYGHTVSSLLVMGAFVTIAVAGWYLHKNKHTQAAKKMLSTGAIVAVFSTCVLLGFAHASAVEVWEEQPTKLAMMEGMYESGVPELSLLGIVDEDAQEALTLGIPGGTSFLATGTFDAVYPGLNELAASENFADVNVDELPVNFVYQVYHIMVACFGLICLVLICTFVLNRKKSKHKIENTRWAQWLLIISPLFPFLAIQAGWLTAEVGRQPYVVYPSTSAPDGIYLTTANGVSVSVQPFELVITLVLFFAVYIMLFVGWARVLKKFVSAGPVYETESYKTDAEGTNFSFAQTASSQNGEGVTGKSAKADTPGAPAQISATTSEGGQQ